MMLHPFTSHSIRYYNVGFYWLTVKHTIKVNFTHINYGVYLMITCHTIIKSRRKCELSPKSEKAFSIDGGFRFSKADLLLSWFLQGLFSAHPLVRCDEATFSAIHISFFSSTGDRKISPLRKFKSPQSTFSRINWHPAE